MTISPNAFITQLREADPAEAAKYEAAKAAPVDRWEGRFLTTDDLLNLAPPQPLIEDTIDLNTVAMLAGKWGSYKSFLSLDWAWSIACGIPWANRQAEDLPVLYLAGEGAHGIGLRYRAWTQAKNRAPRAGQFHLVPQTPRLLDREDVNDLCSHVRRLGVRFVVVDTLSKSIAGADENSAKDMSMAIDALYRLQDATEGGTVLAVHHNGKNGDLRGSSALEGGVDTVYVVEKDGQTVTVKRTKRKDGPLDDTLTMQFQQIDLGKDEVGRPVTSGILSQGGETPLGDAASSTSLLSHLLSQPEGDPDSKAQILEATGMSRATFYRALSDLEERGYAQKVGTGSRIRYEATHEARVSLSHRRLTTM